MYAVRMLCEENDCATINKVYMSGSCVYLSADDLPFKLIIVKLYFFVLLGGAERMGTLEK